MNAIATCFAVAVVVDDDDAAGVTFILFSFELGFVVVKYLLWYCSIGYCFVMCSDKEAGEDPTKDEGLGWRKRKQSHVTVTQRSDAILILRKK